MAGTDRLETPWIVVMVLAVVLAVETMYIWHLRSRMHGGGQTRTERPRTEYFNLRQQRREATGYSPIEPPAARGRWNTSGRNAFF